MTAGSSPTTVAVNAVLNSEPMDAGSPLYATLRRHYLFSGLEQDDFDTLVAGVTTKTLEKGEVLFHRGDAATHFYFLDLGQIELNLIAASGEKKVLEVVSPGRTFAEAIAFMQEHKYPVTAEALAASTMAQIPIQAYIDLVYANPDACMRLLSDVCRHLHARVREIENLTIQNARSRLTSYLLDHVVETNDDEATVRLELPRHVIASRLSVKPETLSRLLRSMVDEGILTIEDRVIFVHSLARLRPYD
ncbi:MAG: Crp/Fnr family transcriptional regulator [Gammaproteobacteria bacterium]|nr:Crp/Fnr family transcriptional regulator [Gammaproteobacteria bacterium]MDH5617880.1 Crp/Fnr family transcriptional regulator [Gammaproteobacteria bacterium]